MWDPLALMKLHIEALFTLDAGGRIIGVNEPDLPEGPRFFMGCTPVGNIWRFHRDLSDDMIRKLESVAREEPVTTDLQGPPTVATHLQEILEADRPLRSGYAGPAFRFPGPVDVPEGIVYVTEADRHRFPAHWQDMFDFMEFRQPCAAIIGGEKAISVCYSSRKTARAAEAGVETLEAVRRRGYGARVVAGWAAAVQASAILPLYSTSWDNMASRSLARGLGLEMYGSGLHFT